jgi:hypothetical protein
VSWHHQGHRVQPLAYLTIVSKLASLMGYQLALSSRIGQRVQGHATGVHPGKPLRLSPRW